MWCFIFDTMDLNKFLEEGFSSLREEIEQYYYEDYFMCSYQFDLDKLNPFIKWDDAVKMILARYKTEIYTNKIYRPGTYSTCHLIWNIFDNGNHIIIQGDEPENLR